jgi:predicted anti-sigma-YlaC factor YlaD
MKCIRDTELLSRYLEKDLSVEEMNVISSHLSNCSACRKELERLSTAMTIMKSVREVAAPRNYAETVKLKLKLNEKKR